MPAINAAASPVASINPPANTSDAAGKTGDEQTTSSFSAVLEQRMTDAETSTANSSDATAAQDASQTSVAPLLLGSNELAEWLATNFGMAKAAKPAPEGDEPVSTSIDPMLGLPVMPVAVTAATALDATGSAESTSTPSLPADIAAILGKDQSKTLTKSVAGVPGEVLATPTTDTAGDFAALSNALAPAVTGSAVTAPQAATATSPAIVAVSELGDTTAKALAALPNNMDASQVANRDPNANAAAAALAQATPSSHATGTGTEKIDTPVGAAGWANDVGNRLAWMANNQQGRAELVLTPPQFGRIEISLSVSGDQATAMFVSANPAVRETLEGALPRLREILADAGITLGQAQVGSESPGQSANNRENGDNSRHSANAGFIGDVTSTRANANVANPWSTTGRSMVDVFA
jgi:flagellar hook-length control protein FliK